MPFLSAFFQDLSDFASIALLALLQGLTEFLPVSSSGHLVLAQSAMGFDEPPLVTDIALHVGTLIAVVLVYRRDLLALARDVLSGKGRELFLLAVGSVPAALVGIGLGSVLADVFHRPRLAAGGLLVTAAVLAIGERARRRRAALPADAPAAQPREIGWREAILIGLAQAFAIWPGVSRSGSTIACGLVLGLRPAVAARFSFLLSIPAILGAAVLNVPDAMGAGGVGAAGPLLFGVLLAGLVGWAALRVLLAFLDRGAFACFAAYCALLGAGILIFT